MVGVWSHPSHEESPGTASVAVRGPGYHTRQGWFGRTLTLHEQNPNAHFHVRIDAAGQYAANLEQFLRGLNLPMTLSIGEPKRNKDYQRLFSKACG